MTVSETFDEAAMAIVRRAYARQMLTLAGASGHQALEDAFATVRREDFLGPPPWKISQGFNTLTLPTDDPVPLYQDVLLALLAERGINNGSPSLHARWLNAASLRRGDRVAHLGAGGGYYSAIIAELVGASGHVTAIEIDSQLAQRASSHLADRTNVDVSRDDAFAPLGGLYDCIYVNFAVERPVRSWTDSLAPGGRLIFPLGVAQQTAGAKSIRYSNQGIALHITRKPNGLAARWLGRAYFICAEGEATVSAMERDALATSLGKSGAEFIQSLHWDHAALPERNWHTGDGWRLSYDAVPE